jgi:hypothetical protein
MEKIKVTESGGFKKIHYISAENGTVTTTVESSVMAMDALDLIQMSDILKNVPGRLQDMFIFALDYDKFHSDYDSTSLPSFEGTARCHEEDEFDEKVGCIVSSMKADRVMQRAAAKKYKDASAMLARLAEITSDLAEKHYEYAEKLKEEASDFDASKIRKKEEEKEACE